MADRTRSRLALWAARLLLPLGTLVSAAAEPREAGSRQLSLSADDFAYYRQSKAIIDNILAGDLSSAEAGVLRLAALERPQALVIADVHSTIGIAFGEAGHFESGIVHVERALAERHDDLPAGLVAEALAYLVHFHVALARFEEAERLLGSAETRPAWLFAKLAIVYADLEYYRCAIANLETALRRAHAHAPVVSRWASRHVQDEVEREAVLADWSLRLQALRKSASPSPEGVAPAVCVQPGVPERLE